MNMLNKNVLSIRYSQNKHSVYSWPRTNISNNLKRAIIDILHHHDVNLANLDKKDKSVLYTLIKRSHANVELPVQISDGEGIHKAVTKTVHDLDDSIDKLQNRWNILSGEYDAYSGPVHNPTLICQLHNCIRNMKRKNIIDENQARQLMEIYK
jgi:hypothetical protein